MSRAGAAVFGGWSGAGTEQCGQEVGVGEADGRSTAQVFMAFCTFGSVVLGRPLVIVTPCCCRQLR
jgi:hypothetical protein